MPGHGAVVPRTLCEVQIGDFSVPQTSAEDGKDSPSVRDGLLPSPLPLPFKCTVQVVAQLVLFR